MSKWVAMNKTLAGTFSEIRREYSKIEAMYSLSLDINCGKARSLRSYSRMWSWSIGKVKRFIEAADIDGTATEQQRNSNGTDYTVILLNKQDNAEQQRNSNGTATEHKYKEQEQEQYKKTMSGKTAQRRIPYKKIIDYLNKKADAGFKPEAQSTRRLIKARFNESFTEQNFYSVIDLKVDEWSTDEKMNQYLRPQTLFGTKFESYLQKAGNGAGRKVYTEAEKQALLAGSKKTAETMINVQ